MAGINRLRRLESLRAALIGRAGAVVLASGALLFSPLIYAQDSAFAEGAQRSAPAAALATTDEVREVRDPLPMVRAIDLTASPDDLWERIRNGFGMPNLASPLVLDRLIWYASRPSTIKRIVVRSRLYL